MPQNRKKPKLFKSNLISFGLLVLLPTILIILFLSNQIRKEMISQNTKIETDSLVQMAYNINSEIKNNEIIASAIVHDEEIIDISIDLKKAKTRSENYQSHTQLDKLLEAYLVNNNFVGEIYLVFDNEKFHLSRNSTCVDASYSQLLTFLEGTNNNIDKTQIVDNLFIKFGNDFPSAMALVTYPPSNWGYKQSFKAEVLIAPLKSINQFYKSERLQDSNKILLLNQENRIIASNETSLIGTLYNREEEQTNENQILIERKIGTTNWNLVKIVDSKTITQNVDNIFKVVYLSLIVLFILYLSYNTILLLLITKPLTNLIESMKKVGQGEFKKYDYFTVFEEMDSLGNSFNSMVTELEALNKQITKAHNETLIQEIEALRFQINPHFMCNSLGAIRMMALIAKNDAIKRMSTALMVIMEDNLTGTGSFAPLSHEIKNIDSYIYIMQVRYGDTFSFEKLVDKDCLKAELPSMLLQPLIENSILHGIRGIDKEGLITLTIKKEQEKLKIIIHDNGKGIDKDRIKNIFKTEQHHNKGLNRIGLNNVKRRIEILYGKNGQLKINSDTSLISSFCELTIIIPFKETEELSIERRGRKEY